MFARRIIPAVPPLFVALEILVNRFESLRTRGLLVVGLLLAAGLPLPLYDEERLRIGGIADERRFYPQLVVEAREYQARTVAESLAGSPVRVAIAGGMLAFGYYSKLPYVVELTGLTQYSLAKSPISERGRIGHEKSADDTWLREHGVHLLVSHEFPPVNPPPRPHRYDDLYFGSAVRARIVSFSVPVMNALRRDPAVTFTPIEQMIDEVERQIEDGSLSHAEQLTEELYDYYFRTADETAREEYWALRRQIDRQRACHE